MAQWRWIFTHTADKDGGTYGGGSGNDEDEVDDDYHKDDHIDASDIDFGDELKSRWR